MASLCSECLVECLSYTTTRPHHEPTMTTRPPPTNTKVVFLNAGMDIICLLPWRICYVICMKGEKFAFEMYDGSTPSRIKIYSGDSWGCQHLQGKVWCWLQGAGLKVLALTDMVSAALPFIGTFENLKLKRVGEINQSDNWNQSKM